MKRLFLIAVAAVALTVSSVNAEAQFLRYGIIGGFTSSDTKLEDLSSLKVSSAAGYHIGATVQVPLLLGFRIQPQLIYQSKGSSLRMDAISTAVDTRLGYLELPVQLQWGVDLLAFRPYVFAEPFVGYALNTKTKVSVGSASSEVDMEDGINRFEYGCGLGAGVDVWKLQLSVRYFWNFGSYVDGDLKKIPGEIGNALKDGTSFNGVVVSLAYFF